MFAPIRFAMIALLGLFLTQTAFASPESEAFVKENAELVLSTLGDDNLSKEARTAKFQEYMNEFSDQPRIARYVIGKYAKQFSQPDLARYKSAFTDYSLASYEANFDAFRGGSIKVDGSKEGKRGRWSFVRTTVTARNGDKLEAHWRLQINKDGSFQVFDVGLNLDGNLIWLGLSQRDQLLAFLDRNQGSADALIGKLEELTAELRAKSS